MANKNVTPPLFPIAPTDYSQQFMDQLLNVLRLYLSQSNNSGPMIASSQNVGSTTEPVISGLTFAAPDPADRRQFKISLPTDADFTNLRSGDVYYDTSGGVATSYPLRIKA